MQSNLVDRSPALGHDGPVGSLKRLINCVERFPVGPRVGTAPQRAAVSGRMIAM